MMRWYRTRSDIAKYLGISRMTLNRWEKILPLVKGTLRHHAFHLDKSDVKAWYEKLRDKYRPYQSYETSKRLEKTV